MNGEILIKARKVIVEDNIVEVTMISAFAFAIHTKTFQFLWFNNKTLPVVCVFFYCIFSQQNSEDCPHCMSKGLQKKLRYFFLSLEEKIYKCENSTCLYPFSRFIFKSLIDNSVYYYEEVLDGRRELFFRVPLYDQNDGQLSNPLGTQMFCDNQRNPNIEDYNCDFSDLFSDFDGIDEAESSQTNVPASADNPDALEFLDEFNVTTANSVAGHGTNENDIDRLIDDILNESPMQCNPKEPLPSTSAHRSALPTPKPKPKPKLVKCIQHLEKAKKAQGRKKASDKSKQSFTAAILEARKNQAKVQDSSASTKPQSKPTQTPYQMLKSKQKSNSSAAFSKSTNNLRPSELARTFSTLKSLNTNSQFLQQYMKSKEENFFCR